MAEEITGPACLYESVFCSKLRAESAEEKNMSHMSDIYSHDGSEKEKAVKND